MKVRAAINRVWETLSLWDCVDAITLMEHQEDIYDPYFFISMDVYVSGNIPAAETRSRSFGYVGAFEAGTLDRKDRFILDDFPFRLEYKNASPFDKVLGSPEAQISFIRNKGSYLLYRLMNSQVLFQRGDWLSKKRKEFQELPDQFWQHLRQENQARMEHYLNDIGAAAIRDDRLFFTISSSGYLKGLSGLLYAVNRVLEPSARFLSQEIYELPVRPDSFSGGLDSFLRENSLHRKHQIAEHLAIQAIRLSEG